MLSKPDLYRELFRRALRIRLVEEKLIELYPSDKIQSPVHLSIGQEAVAVGVCEPLRKSDLLFCNYRSHAFYMAKGGDLNEMMAELYGKVDGCGRGKAGSMHLLAPEVGLMQASAVVAASIPQAVGAALSFKRKKNDDVIIAVFGDGATEQGVVHESMNFAALHQLPVIFVCENNGFAVHSHLHARQAYQITSMPQTYGIATTQIAEGYDFMKIQEVFSGIVAKVRKERTPQFVEIKTCRYKEHVGTGDDYNAGYRSVAEKDQWTAKDPLIQDKNLVQELTPALVQEIEASTRFAEASPWPGIEELLAHV